MNYTSVCLAAAGLVAVGAQAQPIPVHDLGLLPGDGGIFRAEDPQLDQSVAKGGDQYLAVWTDHRGASVGGTNQGGGEIFGVRLDEAGNPVDALPFPIVMGMGLQQRPLVAWNGTAWLVVYISQDPVNGYFEDRLRAVRVSSEGVVLDATPISFPASQFTPDTIGLQVSGQSGQWLVSRCIYHADGYGTYLAGQRISGAGVLLDPAPRVLNDWVYGQTRLLAANGEYLAVGPDWNNSATIKARRIDLNAQPIGASFTVPGRDIATNGNEYYVTWIRDFVNLVGSRMTSTGTLLTPSGTMIAADFSQYTHAVLAHDGTNWWVEWGVSDILRTVRINAAGQVLDPNGGVLLPISIGGNINNAYNTLLTPRAGGGVHLFWYDIRDSAGYDSNVWALPISGDNVAGTERCISTSTRVQRTADLAAGPDGGGAAVFVSEATNDDRVLVHLLDRAGRPRFAEPIEVFAGPTVGKASIAWNGSEYMVVFDVGASGLTPVSIRARRLDAAGNLLDESPIELMVGFGPDVEALGDDFLVTGTRFDTNPQFIYAHARRIDGPTGTPLDATPFILGGGYVSAPPRVHTDGTRWIVTYHSNWSHDDSRSDVVYNFVSADGVPTAPLNPTTTSGGAGHPDVAFSGGKFLFVWRSNTLANANNFISGRVMNSDGTFATGNFTIAEAPGRQLRPVVTWDGVTFVVSWEDQRNQQAFYDERTDIYGARVTETGTVLDPTGFVVQRSPHGDAAPAIVTIAPGRSLAASSRFTADGEFASYRVGLTLLGDLPCAADVNGDGLIDSRDFFEFLASFFNGDADFNRDGVTNSVDFFDYLGVFFGGCE